MGRLKSTTEGGTTRAYEYDLNGNRSKFTLNGGGQIVPTYDNQDRLLTYGTTSYTYGSNGELKTKAVSGVGTTSYTYDALGNLMKVVLPSGTDSLEYLIDGQNRRVGVKLNGTLQKAWVYQNQLNPVAELDGSGTLVSRFVYGSRANVPDYMVKGDTVYRLISDHLGSVRLVVDTATGAVAQRIDYDEFGVATVVSGAGFQPFGFAGGLADDSTKFVRFGARDYEPGTGRWTAKDPVGFAGFESSLYSYVFADPINLVDPRGADARSALGNFVGGAVVGAVTTYAIGVAVTAAAVAASPFVAAAAATVAVGATAYGAFQAGQNLYELGTGSDWSSGRALSCDELLDRAAALAGALVGGRAVGRGFSLGREVTGEGWRAAPFGNRTGNRYGELPHYHRRIQGPDGNTVPGGSMRWHRPWEYGW